MQLAAKSTLGVATDRRRGRKALLATQPESLNCRPGSTLSASPLLPSPSAGSARERTGVVANFIEEKRSGNMSKSASGATQAWVVDLLTSKRKYDGKLGLSLQFMDASGIWSDSVKIDKDWKEDTEAREKELQGTRHVGRVTLPEGVIPVAVALEQLNATEKDKTYIVKLELTSANSKTVSFPTQGYLTKGRRVFFDGKARLPADTPEPLAEARKKELDALKGVGNPAANDMRKGDERIYAFQVYNDLGDDKDIRPVLGGKEMPYPRRMRTGRPNYPGTPYEVKPEPRPLLPIPWMPLDDDFDTDKSIEFVGGAVTATLPALQLIFRRDKQEFKDIRDVLKLYDADRALLAPALPGLNPLTAPFRFIGNALFRTVRFIVWTFIRVRAAVRNGLGLGKNSLDVVGSLFKSFKDLDDVFEYPAPFNLAKTDGLAKSLGLPKPQDPYRVDSWRTDAEFGRQFLAGLNPLTIEALSTTRPLPKASAITLEALTAHLEGHALSELLAAPKPRLFVVDLYDTFIDYVEAINKEYTKPEDTRVQHAGHCVLYLRNDGYLVPIAIDLTSSKAKPPAVYTPADPGNVWNLAKAVFASIDSTHHQMMSHWLRTHACQEPFLIATHRNLSTMHPVYKLIMPHFRYTMPINAAARTLLVQAGGVVESNFTPGKYNLSLTSLWYSKHWRFETEALPADLQLRGLMSDEGEVLLDDFPYAQDGLLIWNALDKYFTQYIDLYYTSDADVSKDPEIQAWWTDIQSEGHPDKKEGWAPMTSKAALVRALATMAWIGSGHHAAVNFGQYDYAAFMPNRSANTRKPMPVRGSPEYQALAAVKPSTDDGDRLLLTYLGGPLNTTQVATLCKALAGHAADEQYLSDPDQPLLTDPDAKAAHARFVTDILASEATIAQRNADPKYLTRNLNKSGLPYRYMIATSKPGLTGQGVPYSVSI